jgi:hypothetical protein
MTDDPVKLTAKRVVERIDKQNAFVAAELGSVSRWLTASLFALNGGSAAAFLTASDVVGSRALPVSLFGAGVVFAMLGAVVIQELYGNICDLLNRQDLYWSRVAVSGRRLRWAEARFRKSRRKRYRFAFVAPALGFVSGALFVSGLAVMALR